MKSLLWFCILLFAFLSKIPAAHCADLTTRDGKLYRDFTVKSVDGDGLRIIHRDGAAFCDFDTLPTAVQSQYGWTPDKSAARKVAQVAALEKQHKAAMDAQQAQQTAQAAADKLKTYRASTLARNEERLKLWAAHEQDVKRANENRIQKAGEEQRASEQNKLAMSSLLMGVGALFIYFLPTVFARKKSNRAAIFMLNFLAGWTFIGWVIAMVWACTKDAQPANVVQTIIIQNPSQAFHAPRPIPRVVSANVIPQARIPQARKPQPPPVV